MMGRTHALIGLASVWSLSVIPGLVRLETVALLSVAAAFGALLPDLDAAESQIKHLKVSGFTPFTPLAVMLNRRLGYRGALHSLLGLGIASLIFLLLGFWWDWNLPLSLALGYATHLAADACTKAGILFLFPRRRRYHLLPRRWRITTDSAAEEVLFCYRRAVGCGAAASSAPAFAQLLMPRLPLIRLLSFKIARCILCPFHPRPIERNTLP